MDAPTGDRQAVTHDIPETLDDIRHAIARAKRIEVVLVQDTGQSVVIEDQNQINELAHMLVGRSDPGVIEGETSIESEAVMQVTCFDTNGDDTLTFEIERGLLVIRESNKEYHWQTAVIENPESGSREDPFFDALKAIFSEQYSEGLPF